VTKDTAVPQNVAARKLKEVWVASSVWEGGKAHTGCFLPTSSPQGELRQISIFAFIPSAWDG